MKLVARSSTLALAVVLGVLARAPAQDASAEGRLTVLTYNVHGLPAFITGDDTLARQRAIAPLLEAYDLCGLQEDWTDEGHALLVGAATHPTRLRPRDAIEGRVYGTGLSCLARARLVSTAVRLYTAANGVLDAGSDGLASKGFVVARLELAPGVEVDVYDTHCDAGDDEGDRAARSSQVAQLEEAMGTLSAGRAVLFLGDTNLDADGRDGETWARWLASSGLTCACRCARSACCGRIDRVLSRGGAGVELVSSEWGVAPGFVDARGRPLSDHEPLRVVLRWRRLPL